jgi:hypothetical protein
MDGYAVVAEVEFSLHLSSQYLGLPKWLRGTGDIERW